MTLQKIIVENLYRWIKDGSAPPSQISICPTDLCNLKCQSCWQRRDSFQHYSDQDKRKMEVSDQRLLYLISEAHALGVQAVEITGGGEPLMRRDAIAGLVKKIKKADMVGWMTTNGTLFTPELAQSMVALGWDKITISMDGPDAKTNDFLRPPAGSFDRILRTLALFKEYKQAQNKQLPVITFNVVVSRHNIDKLSGIVALGRDYGVEGITFEPVKIHSEKCKELLVDFKSDFELVQQELEKAQELASSSNIFTNIEGMLKTPEVIQFSGKYLGTIKEKKASEAAHALLTVPCIEPWFHLYLEGYGSARPCCVGKSLDESIKEKSLKEIWFGKIFSSFREAILNKKYPESCNQCNANLVCFSQEITGLLKEKIARSTESFSTRPQASAASVVSSGKNNISRHRLIRMLVTDTAPLYPPLWGGPKRIWNLYSNFDPERFYITYVGVDFSLNGGAKYRFTKLRENVNEVVCAFPPHYYLWHAIEKLAFRNTSLDLFLYLLMHTDKHFSYMLNGQNADVIICSHPWSSLCVKKDFRQMFIYDAHNCEYLLMDQILKKHPFKRKVLEQVKRIEGDACRKSNFVIACSENEKKDIASLYNVSSDKIMVIPNGTIVAEKANTQEREETKVRLGIVGRGKIAVFIGVFYKPNNDAVRFIIKTLAPALEDFIFIVIGTVKDAFRKDHIPANVRLMGKVSSEELDVLLRAADIAINPMFAGSGSNIKMLDYMAYGLPIVTTECGSRGIEIGNKTSFVVSSTQEFVDSIRNTAYNMALCEEMAAAGPELIARRYDWRVLSKQLQDTISTRVAME